MNQIIDTIEQLISTLTFEKTATILRLFHKDQVIYEKSTGYANLEHNVRVSNQTVFPISSMTKQFTAAIIYLLEQDGILSYGDSVKTYLPDLSACADNLTINHLLYQMSGLVDPYTVYKERNWNTYNITNKDVYELITKQKLLFLPGEKFSYSNSNYILLSAIIESVTNKKFSEVLSEFIFSKFNMDNSLLYDRSVVNNRAYGYKKTGDNLYNSLDIEWLTYGDGGIHSSIVDLENWYFALYKEEIKFDYSASAFTSGENKAGVDVGYGFGWFIEKVNNHKIVYHLGGDPGFGSMISLFPEKEIGLIMLSNLDGSWRVFNNINKKLKYAINGVRPL